MVIRTIEIDDTLPETIDSCIDDVRSELLNYLEEHPETEEVPDLYNDLDYSGAIHEIIDSSVPIYTSEINDLWYLYGYFFEEAFDDAGIGEKNDKCWPMGWKAAAIYCYIESQVQNWWYNNSKEVFDDWMLSKLGC